jgi:hypothetical protein
MQARVNGHELTRYFDSNGYFLKVGIVCCRAERRADEECRSQDGCARSPPKGHLCLVAGAPRRGLD